MNPNLAHWFLSCVFALYPILRRVITPIWTMLIEWGSNCQRMVCSKRGFSQQIDGMYTPLNKLVRRVSSMLANRWELGMTTSSTIGHPKKEEVETQEILGNCIYTLGLGLSLSFRWFLWIVTAAPLNIHWLDLHSTITGTSDATNQILGTSASRPLPGEAKLQLRSS